MAKLYIGPILKGIRDFHSQGQAYRDHYNTLLQQINRDIQNLKSTNSLVSTKSIAFLGDSSRDIPKNILINSGLQENFDVVEFYVMTDEKNFRTINYSQFIFLMFFSTKFYKYHDESGGGHSNAYPQPRKTPTLESFPDTFLQNTVLYKNAIPNPKIQEFSQTQFSDFVPIQGKIGEFLNDNPFLFFSNQQSDYKNKINNNFLAIKYIYSLLGATIETLEDAYNAILKDYPNGIEIIYKHYDPDSSTERIIQESRFRGENDVYDDNANFLRKLEKELVVEINTKLFLSKEQIGISLTNQKIKEGEETAVITDDNTKEIAKAAETDYLFNIFAEGFIKGQNENSKIVKVLSDILKTGFLGFGEEATEVKNVNKNASAGLGNIALDIGSIIDIFDNDEKQDFNDKLSQCIILTALKDFAKYSVKLRVDGRINTSNYQKWHYPYGGRIYCVDTEKPNTLINILSSPNGMHRYIKTLNSQDTDTKENLRFNFQLYKIVEKDGISKEYPFLFEDTPDETGQKPVFKDLLLNAYQDSGADDNTKRIIEKKTFGQFVNEDRTGMNNKLQIVDMSIGIKGETVATVRSNIDVTINFSMPSLDIIMAKFEANSRYKDGDGIPEKYEFSFSELLSHNVGSGTGFDGTNASRVLNTSYLPKKNRLVMKIFPEIKNPNALFKNLNQAERQKLTKYIENSGMVLDLLLVNYDAKRTKPVEDDTISITFKGFTKSFLNEPFCDVIATPALRQQLLEKEKKVVEELETIDTYCDIKEVRTRIQDHYKEMKTLRDSQLEQGFGKNKILQKLVERNKLFSVELSGDVIGSLNDNVEKDTQKIIDAGKLATLLSTEKITNSIKPTSQFDTSATEDIRTANKIDFFYFGDLIDAYMDVIYGDPQYYSDNGIEQYRKRDQFRDSNTGEVVPASGESDVSEIRNKFANFPLKVIMPTFLPIVLKRDTNGKQSFVTSTDPKDKISVADVPISVAYFQNWYEEEISRRKTKMYPLGSLINRLLNSLVNNVISDSCYTIGNIEKKYFSIKTDFGAPTKNGVFDEERYNKNLSVFDFLRNKVSRAEQPGGFVKVNSNFSPLLKKLKNVERNKHINYLIIYEQFNSFPDMKALDPQITNTGARTDLDNNDIPQFKQNYNDRESGKTSDFVQSMTFSKTDLPFGEEIRFYNDGLNELSTISAVHDCELETLPLLTMFPGMLSWVDPSFVDGTEIYGSIPWTMGIGGFHITYEVSHKANVESSKLTQLKTTIKTKFVDTGSRGAEQSYIKKCKDRKNVQRPPDNTTAQEVE